MSDPAWQPLVAELSRWEDAGRVADFWLRDDDAVEPTEALERLLAITGFLGVPVVLAVIPAGTGPALADRLRAAWSVLIAVHGWAHANHAPEGQKKQELGAHQPKGAVLAELAEGFSRLRRLHGALFLPMLVPPWNRIDPALIPELPALGFQALSTFGPEKPGPIQMLNSNVDIIDWQGTRGCRDRGALVAEIIAILRDSFDMQAGAVGLLTHHLAHDEPAWHFLAELFQITTKHPAARWRDARELLELTA